MEHLTSGCNRSSRRGLIDLWNSELYEEADWTELDNPQVRSTAVRLPTAVISWRDAKRIHKDSIARGERSYHVHAFIHCYIDDQKFAGEREGIWRRWRFFYEVASHFEGILGVDFSTHADCPEPVKRIQFHKMRVIEHGAIQRGIPTIVNARWGTRETWSYCFDGLPENSVLSIGVVGSGLTRLENRPVFDNGLRKLVEIKRPRSLVIVGSTNYPIFEEIRAGGVAVTQFDGDTCSYFKNGGKKYV